MKKDPDHDILPRPWEYEIVWFSYSVDRSNADHSYIDISFARGNELRRLRFFRPQNLRVEEGFPNRTSGLFISDIRGRQLEGLRVEVGDFEASGGGIYFFAKNVIELKKDSGV